MAQIRKNWNLEKDNDRVPFGLTNSLTDPLAIALADIEKQNSLLITTTGAPAGEYTLPDLTGVTTAGQFLTVVNNDTSTDAFVVNEKEIEIGQSFRFEWDGDAWTNGGGGAEDTSDLFKQINAGWEASGSGPNVAELIDGADDKGTFVRVESNSASQWGFLINDAPVAQGELIRIDFDLDPTATQTAAIRGVIAGATIRDIVIDPTGTDFASIFTEKNPGSLVMREDLSSIHDETVTLVAEALVALPQGWQFYADYGFAGAITSGAGATGGINLRRLDSNYDAEEEITGLATYYEGHRQQMAGVLQSRISVGTSDVDGFEAATISDVSTTELGIMQVAVPTEGTTQTYSIELELDPTKAITMGIYVTAMSGPTDQIRFLLENSNQQISNANPSPLVGNGIVSGSATLTNLYGNVFRFDAEIEFVNDTSDRLVEILPVVGPVPYPGGDFSNLTDSVKLVSKITTDSDKNVEFNNLVGDSEIAIGEYNVDVAVPGAAFVPIDTGIDLTDAYRIEVTVANSLGENSSADSVLMSEIILDDDDGGILKWAGSAFLKLRINSADITSGIIQISSPNIVNRLVTKVKVTKIVAVTDTEPSTRIGEMFYAKSGSTVTGYLPVTPGTVVSGATMYPIWAAMYPEFVSGDDIVFPADVDGMFLRNLGGGAGAEGVFQAEEVGPHTHAYTDRRGTGFVARGNNGNTARSGNFATDSKTSSANAGTETRPDNRAYQLYTIVDSYREMSQVNLVPVEDLVKYAAYGGTDDDNVSSGEYLQLDDIFAPVTPHIDTNGLTFNTASPYNPIIPRDGIYSVVIGITCSYEDGDREFGYNLKLDGTTVDRQFTGLHSTTASNHLTLRYTGPLTTTSELGAEATGLGSDIRITNTGIEIIELPSKTVVSANDVEVVGAQGSGQILELNGDGTASPVNKRTLPAGQLIVGTINGDTLLANYGVGVPFHFQTSDAPAGVTITSATDIGTIIDGDAISGPGPKVIPASTQGYMTKGLLGNVTIFYTTSGFNGDLVGNQANNAILRLEETLGNKEFWLSRFSNRTVLATSDTFEFRENSTDGVDGDVVDFSKKEQRGEVPTQNNVGNGADVKTTTFPTPFLTVPVVTATGFNSTGNGQGIVITIVGITTTGFTWVAHRNDGIPFSNYAGLQWTAKEI